MHILIALYNCNKKKQPKFIEIIPFFNKKEEKKNLYIC